MAGVILKLNFQERMVAFMVFSGMRNANLADWNVLTNIKQKIGLDDAVREEFKVVNMDDGSIKWDEELGNEEREYEFSPRAFELLKSRVKELDTKAQLEEGQISLARKVLEDN